MNRRRFFRTLAAAAPALFLPKLIKPAWKVATPEGIGMETVCHNGVFVPADYWGTFHFVEEVRYAYKPFDSQLYVLHLRKPNYEHRTTREESPFNL